MTDTTQAATHTTGEWVYRPDEHDDWGVVKDVGGFVICQARDGRFCDDDALNQCRREDVDPWEAPARLIAAAPDMLPALKEALRSQEFEWAWREVAGYSPDDNPAMKRVLDAIAATKAAIAKAEPQAQGEG